MWKVNKLLVGLCCVVTIALTASSASAITITLSDLNPEDHVLAADGSSYSDAWNLTGDTDWPALGLGGWNIDSVQVVITIAGDDVNGDQAAFYFDSTLVHTAGPDTGPPPPLPLDWSETWTSDLVVGSFSLFASISLDGILNYTVTRTGGNGFTVTDAALTVVATEPEISAVPDGGTTLTMLGLGMFGLGALRRKLGA